MDAPRDLLFFYFFFFLFSPNEQRGGGGGGGVRCQTFSFSFFPCSADHERDWPPCKVVFFGLATNALNVRNNNNNNNIRTGPTDADAFRGHRLTTQKGYTYQKEIKGPRKVNTHAIIGK